MLGIINIDKPAGCTSHDVVAFVRMLAGRKVKVGHSGTLDPFATGVLPVFIGKATRLIQFIPADVKSYDFDVDFSYETDSADIDGKTTKTISPDAVPTIEDVKDAAVNFTGKISQTPPMFSAVSVNGVRLYKLARQGKVVERPSREVEIFSLELSSYSWPVARFSVKCSRGTYVRSLAVDIGKELGVCGCVIKLRRTYSGGLHCDTSLTPFSFASKYIHSGFEKVFSPIEDVFGECLRAKVSTKTLSRVKNGNKITEEGIDYIKNDGASDKVLLFSQDGSLVAMYRKADENGILAAEKVLL